MGFVKKRRRRQIIRNGIDAPSKLSTNTVTYQHEEQSPINEIDSVRNTCIDNNTDSKYLTDQSNKSIDLLYLF